MRREVLRSIVPVLVAALALVPGSCSKSKSENCTEANAVDLSGDNPLTITISANFDQRCFKASSAASIAIVNKTRLPHTFTIDGTQVDAIVPAGETFNEESAGLAAGTYPFRCKIHPSMTGTIIVRPPPAAAQGVNQYPSPP